VCVCVCVSDSNVRSNVRACACGHVRACVHVRVRVRTCAYACVRVRVCVWGGGGARIPNCILATNPHFRPPTTPSPLHAHTVGARSHCRYTETCDVFSFGVLFGCRLLAQGTADADVVRAWPSLAVSEKKFRKKNMAGDTFPLNLR
jgi:hypothetical protein